ncbi:MAG: PadR family transcriptional regulator [Acidimicrobiales bacterium]
MFEVRARVERFVEPSLLLLLSEGSNHGYELAEQVESLLGEGRVDLGNLYRLLRSLEAEGLVRSTWSDDLPGPLKRTYELTDEGRALLDAWAESLRAGQQRISTFLQRYDNAGNHTGVDHRGVDQTEQQIEQQTTNEENEQ